MENKPYAGPPEGPDGNPMLDLATEKMWCKSHWTAARALGFGGYSFATLWLFTLMIQDERAIAMMTPPGEAQADLKLFPIALDAIHTAHPHHVCCWLPSAKLQTAMYNARQGKPPVAPGYQTSDPFIEPVDPAQGGNDASA